MVVPTDDRAGTAELYGPLLGISGPDALESPHALVGTPEAMAEDLLARRERWGISTIGVSIDAIEAMAPVIRSLRGT